MDNSIDTVYRFVGELYLNTRAKILELESSLSSSMNSIQQLTEERDRLLGEMGHLRMNLQKNDQQLSR